MSGKEIVEVVVLLAVGGLGTSFIEYKLNYNVIDKLIDVFRGAEQKVAALQAKVDAATAKIKKIRSL